MKEGNRFAQHWLYFLAIVLASGIAMTGASALAADRTVTHVMSNTWQATDFHDPANPGCSIGAPGSVPGSRLIMGASKSHPDPMSLVVRKTGWTLPVQTPVEVQFTFSDGFATKFVGRGSGSSIEIELSADRLRVWVHELTANASLQASFAGNEPAWTFDLAGTTAVINAMGDCAKAHEIAGIGAPFNGALTAASTQPFGGSLGPDASLSSAPASQSAITPSMPPSGALSRAFSSGKLELALTYSGGTLTVPASINNAITLSFIVDSGAADVSIPADVVLTLIRTGTITENDFLGKKNYTLADGRTVPADTFRIRTLKVGDRTLTDVLANVAPPSGNLLPGQSFLSRFQSWSIDNRRQIFRN